MFRVCHTDDTLYIGMAMSEYLKYVSDTLPLRPLWKQIFFEYCYKLEYFFGYLLGFIFELPSKKTGSKRPVVLIPGFFGRSWNFFRLRRHFMKNGHPVYLPKMGFQVGSIYKKSERLAQYLEKNDIRDCYIIGHSMGGLITASMGYKGRDRVRKMYTVGSPLKGTYLAILLPIFAATLQMTPYSKFTKNFKLVFSSLSNVQSIFAKGDEVIFPQNSAHMGRFDDVMVPEYGHLNLIMGPLGIESLTELVRQEEAKDPLPTKEPKKSRNKNR